MCRFYLTKDLHMCLEYSESEVQRIFDLKKDYEQDENLFTWLDEVSQKHWRLMEGSALTIDGQTKKADLTLRTLLSREKDIKTQIMINNNLGVNSWLNAKDIQASENRF